MKQSTRIVLALNKQYKALAMAQELENKELKRLFTSVIMSNIAELTVSLAFCCATSTQQETKNLNSNE